MHPNSVYLPVPLYAPLIPVAYPHETKQSKESKQKQQQQQQ